MKYLLIFALAFIIIQCKTLSFEKTPPFTITKASYNAWLGGQPGISGIGVQIQFKANTTIAFDEMYFQNRICKVEIRKNSIIGYYNTSTFEKVDKTLDSSINKEYKNKVSTEVKFPFTLKDNEAVVSYKVNNHIKYYKIKNIVPEKTPRI